MKQCRAKYNQVTKCVQGLHANYFNQVEAWNKTQIPQTVDMGPLMGGIVTLDNRDHRSRDFYQGEDFADLVGAVSQPNENFWCGLYQTYDLTPTGVTSAWLPQARFLDCKSLSDVHSSSLFRLLNIEVQSGRPLRNECKVLVERENYELNKCFE